MDAPARGTENAPIRATSGKILTALIALFCAIGLASFLVRGEPSSVLRYGPACVAVVYGCWLLFWYPCVIVEPSGVVVRTVFRTHRVTWPAIARVETRYALTIATAHDKVVAWSAPAPSRYAGFNNTPADIRGIDPELRHTEDHETKIRPGDLPRSESGSAALQVRRAWLRLRDAGHLATGAIEGPEIRRTWNVGVSIAAAVLVAVGVVVIWLV
jgi:hypothetical protein